MAPSCLLLASAACAVAAVAQEVPAELKGEFRRGDSVQGMRVEAAVCLESVGSKCKLGGG